MGGKSDAYDVAVTRDVQYASGRRRMPMLLAWGEQDLDYVIPGAQAMAARLLAAGHPHQTCLLPGQTHFYPTHCAVNCSAGPQESLEHAIEHVLDGTPLTNRNDSL